MNKEEMALLKFFSMVFPLQRGYIELRALPAYPTGKLRRSWVPIDDKGKAVRIALGSRQTHNVYFGACTRSKYGKGTKKYLSHLTSLWGDLDEEKFEWGLASAMDSIEGFPLSPSALVATGHGIHSYYLLEEPLRLTEGVAMAEALLGALQEELGSDRVNDVTRVLRVPGTLNLKEPEDPKPVELLSLEPVRYPLEEFVELLDWEETLGTVYDLSKGRGLKEEELNGIEKVLTSDFVQYCREHAERLSEPLWYALITNLIPFKDGRKAIHELSKPYPRYSVEETESKIGHALRDAPGPHTARYIEEHGFRCEDCIKEGARSPAGLAFK